MVQIGGKTKKAPKASQLQFVVQESFKARIHDIENVSGTRCFKELT